MCTMLCRGSSLQQLLSRRPQCRRISRLLTDAASHRKLGFGCQHKLVLRWHSHVWRGRDCQHFLPSGLHMLLYHGMWKGPRSGSIVVGHSSTCSNTASDKCMPQTTSQCQLNMLCRKAEAIKYHELKNYLWVLLVINTQTRKLNIKCVQVSTVVWTECALHTSHSGFKQAFITGAWCLNNPRCDVNIYFLTCYPKSQRSHVWRISNSRCRTFIPLESWVHVVPDSVEMRSCLGRMHGRNKMCLVS